jgi:hypothetical protein
MSLIVVANYITSASLDIFIWGLITFFYAIVALLYFIVLQIEVIPINFNSFNFDPKLVVALITLTLGAYYYISNIHKNNRLRIVSLATSCIKEINNSCFEVFYFDRLVSRNKAKGVVDTQLSHLEIYLSQSKSNVALGFKKSNYFKASQKYEEYIESIKLHTNFEQECPHTRFFGMKKRDDIMQNIYSASVELLRALEDV